jgi:hypothetical protein
MQLYNLSCPLKIHLHLIILILYLQQLVLQYRQNYIIYSTIFHLENAHQTEHGWHKELVEIWSEYVDNNRLGK